MADRLSPKKSEKRGFAGFNLKKKKIFSKKKKLKKRKKKRKTRKYLRVFSQKAVSR